MNLQEINNVLIIAPHADDETLGCGGIINKFVKEGKNVNVLILTNAFKGDSEIFSEQEINKVRQEALDAHRILGVENTIFADFPAPRLDTFPLYKVANYISNKLIELNIDTLFIPHRGDIHLDHRRTFEASIVAARPFGDYKVKRIYSYETLSETEWAAPYPDDNFVPNVFFNITNELEKKIEAFECYKSQLKEYPHPRSINGIKILAQRRGIMVSFEAAEAFSLVREII